MKPQPPSKIRFHFLVVLSYCLVAGNHLCQARELKVSRAPGSEFTSIQQAVNKAQPGDVIALSPEDSPYYESVSFHNKSGEPEKPIILDGRGATLDGSAPLRADEWEQTEPGLFRSTAFAARMRVSDSILGRYFFVMNGAINRMNRSSKGTRAAFKTVADLQTGEWTFIESEKAFYIRLAPEQKLESVRAPERSSGVALSGDCEHLIIRNLSVTHVWNDGFNIHQRSRDVRFENIRAIECGDDGISAHEDCWISVDGLFSARNSTGFCHVGQSRSETKNFVLEDNSGYGIYLVDDSTHTASNGVVRSPGGYALRLRSKATLDADNILLIGEADGTPEIAIETKAVFKGEHFSIWNLPIAVGDASAELRHSVIGGAKSKLNIAATAVWSADENWWDVAEIKWHDTVFALGSFAGYARASGQDTKSRSESVTRENVVQGKTAPFGIMPEALPKFRGTL
jgi:hypothetical protein